MKINKISFLAYFAVLTVFAQTADQIKKIQSRTHVTQLIDLSTKYSLLNQSSLDRAYSLAKTNGWDLQVENDTIVMELVGVTDDDAPVYYTIRKDSRSSSDLFKQSDDISLLGLTGKNLLAHIWDKGHARSTHHEYDGSGGSNRYLFGDRLKSYNAHSGQVTGIIMSSGVKAEAKGVAPESKVKGYNWFNDLAEAAYAASQGMLVSNQSYGWSIGFVMPVDIGGYVEDSRRWDEVLHKSPYHAFVLAAGNDARSKHNSKPIDPLNPDYDKLTGRSTSKNPILVANAKKVEFDEKGNLISALISPSSSYGPTDDLRIKPDITALGTDIISTTVKSNDSYGNQSGTSMAAPRVAGSLLLLQEHYNALNGDFMRAATVKGLVLHTASEAGPNGPDAIWGWGVLNMKDALGVISKNGTNALIIEESLSQNQTMTFEVESDNESELKASISWTDLAGNVTVPSNNSTNSVLANDLDLRIVKDQGVHFPWLLKSVSTNGFGDNTKDPFERIDVKKASGKYEIKISHKRNLQGRKQKFSLIVTGVNVDQKTVGSKATEAISKVSEVESGIVNEPISALAAVNITPNPSGGSFTIKLQNLSSGTIEILSLAGKSIYKSNFSQDQNETEVDLRNETKGVYLVKVSSDNQLITKRLILK